MSAAFITFARAHGVEISRLDDSGKIRRCGTTEHPRSNNGAYAFDGHTGWVFAWDGEGRAIRFDDPSAPSRTHADIALARSRRLLLRQERETLQHQAERKAAAMLSQARLGEHGYLQLKGFKDEKGLVLPDDTLFVPMRDIVDNRLVGAQTVRWLPDERRWEKKYLYGQRSECAALKLGARLAPESYLVEGYATGLSVAAALRQMRSAARVIVTFSAHNLIQVAKLVRGPRYVIADHDANGVGQRAAATTGLPWASPDVVGQDANDLHQKSGLAAVCGLLVDVRRVAPAVAPAG